MRLHHFVFALVSVYVSIIHTFSQWALISGLAHGEDGLNDDAHAALGGVNPAHHTEPEPLLAGALLKHDGVQGHGQRLGPRGHLMSWWWPPDHLGLTSDGWRLGPHLTSPRPQLRGGGCADLATLRGHDGGRVHIWSVNIDKIRLKLLTGPNHLSLSFEAEYLTSEVNIGERNVWLWLSWWHAGCSVHIAVPRHRVFYFTPIKAIIYAPGVGGWHRVADVDDCLHAPGPVLAEVTDIVHIGPRLRYHPGNRQCSEITLYNNHDCHLQFKLLMRCQFSSFGLGLTPSQESQSHHPLGITLQAKARNSSLKSRLDDIAS